MDVTKHPTEKISCLDSSDSSTSPDLPALTNDVPPAHTIFIEETWDE